MVGLDAIETASRDEIAALQRERLAWTLRHAYANVPHYRAAFDRAGVHPDDFHTLDDIAKFRSPPSRTCAPTIRPACRRPREKLCACMPRPAPREANGGLHREGHETRAHVVARSIHAAGWRSGMIVPAYGYGLSPAVSARTTARRSWLHGCPCIGHDRAVQLIADFQPDVIMVTPSYMLAIMDEFRRH
jgi:phenylacetate-CoA ligase